MEKSQYKKLLMPIYDLIARSQIDLAIDEIKRLSIELEEEEVFKEITLASSIFFRIRNDKIKGIKIDQTEQENKLVEMLLFITGRLEETIIDQNKVPGDSDASLNDIDANSLKDLILEFKKESDAIYEPTESELDNLVDFKVKLYRQIFKTFDDKIHHLPGFRKQHIKVVFNRIVFSNDFSEIDKNAIESIVKNTDYAWHEKVLIISALMLSLFNRFDEEKVHLLIDFLTYFEEKVWDYALVALVLSLQKYDKRILVTV